MQSEQAQSRLFTDILTLQESRPASFVMNGVAGHRAAIERTEALLGALSLIEEARQHDEEADPAFRRLEAKVDLLTAMVARTLQRSERDVDRELRWSAKGAELVSDLYFEVGSQGVLRLVVSEKVPEALQIPATVIALEMDGDKYRLWLEFVGLGAQLTEMLDQHLFRTERRAIAERRRFAASV